MIIWPQRCKNISPQNFECGACFFYNILSRYLKPVCHLFCTFIFVLLITHYHPRFSTLIPFLLTRLYFQWILLFLRCRNFIFGSFISALIIFSLHLFIALNINWLLYILNSFYTFHLISYFPIPCFCFLLCKILSNLIFNTIEFLLFVSIFLISWAFVIPLVTVNLIASNLLLIF